MKKHNLINQSIIIDQLEDFDQAKENIEAIIDWHVHYSFLPNWEIQKLFFAIDFYNKQIYFPNHSNYRRIDNYGFDNYQYQINNKYDSKACRKNSYTYEKDFDKDYKSIKIDQLDLVVPKAKNNYGFETSISDLKKINDQQYQFNVNLTRNGSSKSFEKIINLKASNLDHDLVNERVEFDHNFKLIKCCYEVNTSRHSICDSIFKIHSNHYFEATEISINDPNAKVSDYLNKDKLLGLVEQNSELIFNGNVSDKGFSILIDHIKINDDKNLEFWFALSKFAKQGQWHKVIVKGFSDKLNDEAILDQFIKKYQRDYLPDLEFVANLTDKPKELLISSIFHASDLAKIDARPRISIDEYYRKNLETKSFQFYGKAISVKIFNILSDSFNDQNGSIKIMINFSFNDQPQINKNHPITFYIFNPKLKMEDLKKEGAK